MSKLILVFLVIVIVNVLYLSQARYYLVDTKVDLRSPEKRVDSWQQRKENKLEMLGDAKEDSMEGGSGVERTWRKRKSGDFDARKKSGGKDYIEYDWWKNPCHHGCW